MAEKKILNEKAKRVLDYALRWKVSKYMTWLDENGMSQKIGPDPEKFKTDMIAKLRASDEETLLGIIEEHATYRKRYFKKDPLNPTFDPNNSYGAKGIG